MRVAILKPVIFRGEIKKSGTLEVPEATGKHWIAAGAAKVFVDPPPTVDPAAAVDPPPTVDPPAKGGKKGS
jgi:hypothetical protein